MNAGFIGLGRMGAAMAARLIDAGHTVTVWNRTPDKAGPLVERGATLAREVSAACRGKVVITMLADDGAVEAAAFGDGGILHSLPRGAIHVSMSTISVALVERLTAEHASAGQRFVSAPVFGRPDAAAGGRLFILPAGDADACAECQPLFDAMGQKTLPLGPEPRAANVVKLSGNFLIASIMEAVGEAMALVAKAGIDRARYFETLTSTLFTGPLFTTYGRLIADQQFEPAGFLAPLGAKDVRLALAAAEALRVPMPLASLLRDRYLALLAQGGERLDWSAIGLLAARDAGLETAPVGR